MAFEIIKCYKQHFPALRLIGKRYANDDRINGSFGAKWGEWHQNGWFAELEEWAEPSGQIDNGYVGLMTVNSKDQSNFVYWIGILFPAGTEVPEGFSCLDLPESDVGICWIYGSEKNGEIYGEKTHNASYQKLRENGWDLLIENAGGVNTLVFFELYNCPRFTSPDEKGNVILDYGFYLR